MPCVPSDFPSAYSPGDSQLHLLSAKALGCPTPLRVCGHERVPCWAELGEDRKRPPGLQRDPDLHNGFCSKLEGGVASLGAAEREDAAASQLVSYEGNTARSHLTMTSGLELLLN